jgi:threonine/homoserine/homoserine lactone efflux protein
LPCELDTGNWKRRLSSTVVPLWSFLAVTLPLVLTPGASTAVVLRNSMSGGIRAGVETAAGVNSGSILYGLITAFGLALTLRRWPAVWTVLRFGGGLYLFWLAVRSLLSGVAPSPGRVRMDRGGRPQPSIRNLTEGFLTNLLNPSIATFYLIAMPQFVPRGAPVVRSLLLLTGVHVSLALTWHLVWAAAGGRLSHALAQGRARRVLDGVTGVALTFLAVKVLMGGD